MTLPFLRHRPPAAQKAALCQLPRHRPHQLALGHTLHRRRRTAGGVPVVVGVEEEARPHRRVRVLDQEVAATAHHRHQEAGRGADLHPWRKEQEVGDETGGDDEVVLDRIHHQIVAVQNDQEVDMRGIVTVGRRGAPLCLTRVTSGRVGYHTRTEKIESAVPVPISFKEGGAS